MKKQLIESFVVLFFSATGGLLVPNYLKHNKTILFPDIITFSIWTVSIFILFSLFLYVLGPREKLPKVPDGYHELCNDKGQTTKKGFFENGRQISGTRHVYKKDGTLSHIEKCINGQYVTNVSPSDTKST